MEPIPTDQHELVIELLRANQDLLRQNNELLQKQERRERRRLIFKVIWYTILLGIPMVAYYFLYSTFVGLTGRGADVETGGIAVPPGVLEELLKVYTGQ